MRWRGDCKAKTKQLQGDNKAITRQQRGDRDAKAIGHGASAGEFE